MEILLCGPNPLSSCSLILMLCFQVTFPGLISSLSDENMVCSFNIVKGAGEECLGFWHELGLIYPEIQAGTSVQRGVASCWEV